MTTPDVGASGAPLFPARSSGRTDVDRAGWVRPIAPVRPTVDPLLPDLSRGGVDLPALLDRGADALVARDQPGSVALAELLERARGALVRGAPMDVLTALDAGWEGAARTESGWYFRAAALTLLGLPGEAERVLQQAAAVRDRSPALAFLLSVVRSTAGQSAGARTALADALALRPGAPLLRAWDAVLSARGGHANRAQAMLHALDDGGGDDPVIAWARQETLRASAHEQRAVRIPDDAAPSSDTSHSGSARGAEGVAVPAAAAPAVPLDPVDAALRRLGARLGAASLDELEADVRLFMQSLSASGALSEAGRAERSHAVRAVLATLQQLLGRAERDVGGPSSPLSGGARMGVERFTLPLGRALDAYADADGSWRLTPVGVRGVAPDAFASALADGPTLRRAVLEALRAGRPAEAEQLFGLARTREGASVVRVLQQLLEGAAVADGIATDRPGTESAPALALSASRDDSLLSPLRFGLVLLQERSPRREAHGAARGVRASPATAGALPPAGAVFGDGQSGARRGESARADGRIRRAIGLSGLLLAALALLVGNGTVAMLLAGGAVWLLLR